MAPALFTRAVGVVKLSVGPIGRLGAGARRSACACAWSCSMLCVSHMRMVDLPARYLNTHMQRFMMVMQIRHHSESEMARVLIVSYT